MRQARSGRRALPPQAAAAAPETRPAGASGNFPQLNRAVTAPLRGTLGMPVLEPDPGGRPPRHGPVLLLSVLLVLACACSEAAAVRRLADAGGEPPPPPPPPSPPANDTTKPPANDSSPAPPGGCSLIYHCAASTTQPLSCSHSSWPPADRSNCTSCYLTGTELLRQASVSLGLPELNGTDPQQQDQSPPPAQAPPPTTPEKSSSPPPSTAPPAPQQTPPPVAVQLKSTEVQQAQPATPTQQPQVSTGQQAASQTQPATQQVAHPASSSAQSNPAGVLPFSGSVACCCAVGLQVLLDSTGEWQDAACTLGCLA